MTRFLLGRCLGLVLTLLAASAVVFLVLDVLPGDVAQVMLGPDADPQAVQALAVQLGLDRPAWVRYGQWLLGLLQGELGMSQAYGVPVAGLLAERLVLTVPLTLLAMALAGGMALLAGVYAALHHRRWGDVGLMALAQLGMATPGFWLGMLLIVVFSVQLGWLPSGGFEGWEAGLWQGLRFLWLPALALACVQGAILARFVRTSMLEVQGESFVRTARAKGLSMRQVLWGHVFRNASIPVLTVAGMQFAELLAVMISRALRLLDIQPNDRVADLFCGLGNFSLPMAKSGASVIGIEGLDSLVLRAKQNALRNSCVKYVSFKAADLFDTDEKTVASWGVFDKMLLDPPRSGAYAVVKSLHAPYLPKRIVYVSCNPSTFARDAEVLVNKGYSFKSAGIMNMFAQTSHVESIGVFEL